MNGLVPNSSAWRYLYVNFLSAFPNTHRAAGNVFCHRRNFPIQRLILFDVHEDVMNGHFDFDAWAEWIRSLDTSWLFLLILTLVVAVVVVWSGSLQPDNTKEPQDD